MKVSGREATQAKSNKMKTKHRSISIPFTLAMVHFAFGSISYRHRTGTIKCILLLINLNVRLMWLLCSLTLSAFCFLFPLSIQLQRPLHTFLSFTSSLSIVSMRYGILCHRCSEHWLFFWSSDAIWVKEWRNEDERAHESFNQWSEQRNEFLFENFLIRSHCSSIIFWRSPYDIFLMEL